MIPVLNSAGESAWPERFPVEKIEETRIKNGPSHFAGQMMCEPVNLADGPEERLVGNIHLKIRRDATVCRTLATSGYHLDLGARSLRTAVESLKKQIYMTYFEVDEELRADGEVSEFLIDVDGDEVIVYQMNK